LNRETYYLRSLSSGGVYPRVFHGNFMDRIGWLRARERLKPKAGDELHWQRLLPSCFIGCHVFERGGKGNWFA